LHVESVAWIAERKDVLSGLFWMLALWAYVRYAKKPETETPNSKLFYALALIFFALGLMVKPMLISLPCVLLLLDWWPLGRIRFDAAPAPVEEGKSPALPPPSLALVLTEKIPFVLLSIASGVITLIAAHHNEAMSSAMGHLSFKNRLITAGRTYFHYVEKTVWPSDLGPLYPLLFHRPKVELIAIALFLLVITGLAIRYRHSRPYWLVGWLWFVGMLVPTLDFFQANVQPMADRYMYLPSIGLFILICWEAADVVAQWPAARAALGVLCALALAACCVVTWFQLPYWQSESTLISRIPQSDLNYLGHINYASYLLIHNQMADAQAECEKAISIMPGYAPFQAMLGEILLRERKYTDAIGQFRLVQQLDPRMVAIHLPWGRALLAEKRVPDAASEFQKVISADPKNFEAHNLLGAAYSISGKTSAGLEEYRRSLALQPSQPELLNDLAWTLATDPNPEIRNGADAVKYAAQACALTHGTQPIMLGTLAAAYAESGRFDNAVATAQKAHDIAAAEAAAAQKANKPDAARAGQAVAARNLELLQLYRSHQPFHEKAAK
jgi:tetratricopeptide (TPR) repeat protein